MNREQLYKRDSLLRGILVKHKGFENAISTSAIIEEMRLRGYEINARCLPNIIKKLRWKRCLPISYARGRGYFLAVTKEDIQSAIDDMKMQIDSLQTTINFLSGFIFN